MYLESSGVRTPKQRRHDLREVLDDPPIHTTTTPLVQLKQYCVTLRLFR
jgi:hypothetical protein